MENLTSAITRTIPISQFNKGLAGQIFEDVKRNGAKVVIKNNVAECVLMSPDDYVQLIEALENAELLQLASERLAASSATLSQEEMMKKLNIDPAEIENCEGIVIE